MTTQTRRNFLKLSTAAAALRFAAPAAFINSLPASADEANSERIIPFPLSAVRLGPGIFAEQAETNARYLDSLTSRSAAALVQADGGDHIEREALWRLGESDGGAARAF